MNQNFKDIFGLIKDPRVDRTKKHGLVDIIALGILGVMAGAQGFIEVEDFGKTHKDWLSNYLDLENGIPSHDTINRVFRLLNPDVFVESFLLWVQTLQHLFPEMVVPIDGKTLRGSHEKSKGIPGLHVVSAWSCANGLSLGQCRVDGKTNEIKAIPELLKQLIIKDAIVTIDAMGCQKDIAFLIREQGGDYVFGLKGNQGILESSVKDCFKLNDNLWEVYTAKDEISADHGRLETRVIQAMTAEILEGLVELSPWKGLRSIVRMVYTREIKGKTETEIRHFITSLPPVDPGKILHAIRSHWAIESMHWSLDVTFREDSCRIRHQTAALNLAWLRKIALSFLKKETSFKASVRRKQLKLWSSPEYCIQIFKQI